MSEMNHPPQGHGHAPQGVAGHEAAHGEHHEHVLPLKVYFGVFGALIFLTLATVAVSYMNLGPRALFVALIVATIKAALVVGYFMHLKFDVRFHSLIFFLSLLLLVIFFGFTFLDLGSRSTVLLDQETFAYQKDQDLQRTGDSPTGKSPAQELPNIDAPAPPIEAVPGAGTQAPPQQGAAIVPPPVAPPAPPAAPPVPHGEVAKPAH